MRRRSWLAAAGGVVTLLASLRAWAQQAGDVGFPYGDLREVRLEGTLTPLAPLLERKYGARTDGSAGRQLALVLPEGDLYTFLENARFRALAELGPGVTVSVSARRFPRSHLLELLSFERVAAEHVRRRFFCDVCVIYGEEFGPCVCCGKEMQVVREAP